VESLIGMAGRSVQVLPDVRNMQVHSRKAQASQADIATVSEGKWNSMVLGLADFLQQYLCIPSKITKLAPFVVQIPLD